MNMPAEGKVRAPLKISIRIKRIMGKQDTEPASVIFSNDFLYFVYAEIVSLSVIFYIIIGPVTVVPQIEPETIKIDAVVVSIYDRSLIVQYLNTHLFQLGMQMFQTAVAKRLFVISDDIIDFITGGHIAGKG